MPRLSTARARQLAIAGILLLGLVLRVTGIKNGLPYAVSTDEPEVMDRAYHMMTTGQFNPAPFFDYPALTMYMNTAVSAARFMYGAQNGEWSHLSQTWSGEFYLWCRVFTALLGTLTIFIVYRAASRWGWTVALIAAATIAVQPNLVREAHFAKTDTPMAFFVALTFLLSLCANEERRAWWYVLASASAGLAGATKYNGLIAVLMPLTALINWPTGMTLRNWASAALVICAVTAGVFLLAAPFTILDLPAFLNGFGGLMSNVSQPGASNAGVYYKHILNSFALREPRLYQWTAYPGLLLGMIGVGAVLWQIRSPRTRAYALCLLSFPLAYFWVISTRSLVFARYALPLFPALATFLGVGIRLTRDTLAGPTTSRRRRAGVVGLLTLVLALPLLQSVLSDLSLRVPLSAEETAEWLVAHVQPSEPVVVETDVIHLPPGLHVSIVTKLIRTPLEQIRRDGAVYLVTSSNEIDKVFADLDPVTQKPRRHPMEEAAYQEIFRSADPVARFPQHAVGQATYTVYKLRR